VNDDRYGIAGYTASTYGDAFADVYDEWYSSLDDSDFVRYLAKRLPQNSASILELGVGTGRLLEQLHLSRREQGFSDSLQGIDSSAAMLDKCRSREHLSDAIVTSGDFSNDLPSGTFDLIFVGYNTLFNLPDDTALASCFALVNARLSTDGLFAFDVVIPEPTSSPETVTVKSIRADGVTLAVSRHDHTTQRITGQFIEITEEQGVTLRPWSVKYWTPAQLDGHATAAGLELVERISHGDGSAHDADDARHISTYRRIRPHN